MSPSSSLANWDGRFSQPPLLSPRRTSSSMPPPATTHPPASAADARVARPESDAATLPPLETESATPSTAYMSSVEDEEHVQKMLLEASSSSSPLQRVSSLALGASAYIVPPSPRYTSEELANIDVEAKMNAVLENKLLFPRVSTPERDVLKNDERAEVESVARGSESPNDEKDCADSEMLTESVTATDSRRESAFEKEPSQVPGTPESPLSTAPPTPQKPGRMLVQESPPIASQPHAVPPASRSPSVEIIEDEGRGESAGESTLVADVAPEVSAADKPTARPRPLPVRRPDNRKPISISSSSSLSSSPPSRRKRPQVAIILSPLLQKKKQRYLLPSEISWSGIVDTEGDDLIDLSTSHARRSQTAPESPLSPTVSDYERSSIHMLSRQSSPIIVSPVQPTPRSRPGPKPRRPRPSTPVLSSPEPLTEDEDAAQQAYAQSFVKALQISNTRPSVDTGRNVSRVSRKVDKPAPRPKKRKPTSPPPVAGPSRPHKKRQTRDVSPPTAPPRIAPRAPSHAPSVAHSLATDPGSFTSDTTWVTYGLGDDGLDIVGQHSTYYHCEIDLSDTPIEDRIPDPKQLHGVLVSSFRHLFKSVGIDPVALLHERQPQTNVAKGKAREAPPAAEDDDGYESPPRIWDEIQEARARNAMLASPTRRKRLKTKPSPSRTRTELAPAKSPERPVLPAQRDANASAGSSQVERPDMPSAPSVAAPGNDPVQQHIQTTPSFTLPNPSPTRNDVQAPSFPVFSSEVTPSQGLSYNYLQSQYNDFTANAVRGQDAFFGGHLAMDQEMRMDVDETFPSGPSLSSAHFLDQELSYNESAQWMDPSHSLPSMFGAGMSTNDAHASQSVTLNMDAVYPAGNGTIDPSLLGPSTPTQSHADLPVPTPPSASSQRAERPENEDGAEWVQHAKPKPRPKNVGQGKGKGKGKERASDVGYHMRTPLDEQLVAPATPSSREVVEEPTSGKRARKPSTRALQARESFGDLRELGLGEASGSVSGRRAKTAKENWEDSGDDDEEHVEPGSSKISKSRIRELAQEVPYCHQCRGQNRYDKMKCSVLKDGGAPCGAYYCEKCITIRYENIKFDRLASSFKCPRCLGSCNCTSCCAKRKETYVSTRGRKADIPFSALYANAVLRKEGSAAHPPKPHPSKSERAASRPKTTTPAPQLALKPKPKPKVKLSQKEREIAAAMALPEGAVWGTIYGLGMDRIGVGVVADSSKQQVVVRQDLDAGSSSGPYIDFDDPLADTSSSSEDEDDTDESADDRSSVSPAADALSMARSQATISHEMDVRPSPHPAPRQRTTRHFVGVLQPSWTPLPDKLEVIRTLKPGQPAFLGNKQIVLDHYDALGVDVRRGDAAGAEHSDDNALDQCIYGELTPEPDDAEESAQNIAFVIANALKGMHEEGPSDPNPNGPNPNVSNAPVAVDATRLQNDERNSDIPGGSEISHPPEELRVIVDPPMPTTTAESDGPKAHDAPITIAVASSFPSTDAPPFTGDPPPSHSTGHALKNDLPIQNPRAIPLDVSLKLAVEPTSTWSG